MRGRTLPGFLQPAAQLDPALWHWCCGSDCHRPVFGQHHFVWTFQRNLQKLPSPEWLSLLRVLGVSHAFLGLFMMGDTHLVESRQRACGRPADGWFQYPGQRVSLCSDSSVVCNPSAYCAVGDSRFTRAPLMNELALQLRDCLRPRSPRTAVDGFNLAFHTTMRQSMMTRVHWRQRAPR